MQITEKVIATSVSANTAAKKSEFSEKEFFRHLNEEHFRGVQSSNQVSSVEAVSADEDVIATQSPTQDFWANINRDRVQQIEEAKEAELV